MKKIIVYLLVLLMVSGALACSKGGIKDPQSVSGDVKNTEQNADVSETQNNVPTEKPSGEVTIESEVVYDQNGIKITTKSLDNDSFFGPKLKLLIENDSEKNITVQARNVSVNGYMVSALMSADVAAGKKTNDDLTFMESSFEDCGITTIANIELNFHIFDSDEWSDSFDSDKIVIKTSAYDGFEYKYDESGTVAYDDGTVKIVVKGLSEDSILGKEIKVYAVNNGSDNVTVQVRDVSINGFMIKGIFSCDLESGKHAVDGITFLDSDLEENEIEEIKDVELSFHIFNSDNWKTIADSEVIRIEF